MELYCKVDDDNEGDDFKLQSQPPLNPNPDHDDNGDDHIKTSVHQMPGPMIGLEEFE